MYLQPFMHSSLTVRPSKKTNMFSVRVSKKKEGGGAFYFLFFIFKMAAILFKISNIHCFFYCSNTQYIKETCWTRH